MKPILALAIAVVMLMLMAPITLAASSSGSDITAYVSVSVDGELLVAAQPVTIADMTVQGAVKAAHAAYYSGGESGYTAGIDSMFNMYLVTQCWGITATPFIILNGAPLGADLSIPPTVDAAPVAANDNIIISTSSDAMNKPAQPVSLKATLSGDSATVTATLWTLDFMTFMYSSAPLANANVIDPVSGSSLGTTDANGQITVTIPEGGVVAIDGLAAINVKAAPAPAPASAPAAAAPGDMVSYKDAKNYIGQSVTMQDQVFEKVDAGDQWVLFFGGPSTDPSAVGIEVLKTDESKFPSDLYVGKTISITGTLHSNPVGGASFSLTDPSQIKTGDAASPAVVSPLAALPSTPAAAPEAPAFPILYKNSLTLIIVGIIILVPVAAVVIVKVVRQSRSDKPAAASRSNK